MSEVLTIAQQGRIHDEKVVYGYFRNNNFSDINIPIDIINLCIKFYYIEKDQFDSDKLGICHTLKGDIIKHTGEHATWSTTVLKHVVSNGEHSWKFKILKAGAIMIGICNMKNCDSVKDKFFTDNGGGYGFMINSGQKYENTRCSQWAFKPTVKCKDNDVVSMYLDLTKLTLSYSVSDNYQTITFKAIEKTEYKAAVYTYWTDCSVRLIQSN